MPDPNGKIQVIICKCGSIFAGCTEPECYTDKEWQKDLRKYVGEGCKVEMRDETTLQMCKCETKKKKKKLEADLFS